MGRSVSTPKCKSFSTQRNQRLQQMAPRTGTGPCAGGCQRHSISLLSRKPEIPEKPQNSLPTTLVPWHSSWQCGLRKKRMPHGSHLEAGNLGPEFGSVQAESKSCILPFLCPVNTGAAASMPTIPSSRNGFQME